MNIALINGSPKRKDSASQVILNGLRTRIPKKHTICEFHLINPTTDTSIFEKMKSCEALIFAFPLYVDGIPSHLLPSLIKMEQLFSSSDSSKPTVYVLVNCGFYEGHQNRIAIEMMQNWCDRAHLKWGQGIGIGAGGMLPNFQKASMEGGPTKNLGNALQMLADSIENLSSKDTLFITANFPRFAYKVMAEQQWRRLAKKNGLSRKELFRQQD